MTAPTVRCSACGDVLKSESRHDFKYCKCRAFHIDGGDDYFKCGGDVGKMEMRRGGEWVSYGKLIAKSQERQQQLNDRRDTIIMNLRLDQIPIYEAIKRAEKIGIDTSKQAAIDVVNHWLDEKKIERNGKNTPAERRITYAILTRLREQFKAMGS